MQASTVSLRGIIIKLLVFQIFWVLFGECRIPLSLRGIIIKLLVFQIVWVLFGECRLPLCLFVVLSLNLMILFDTKLMMWLFSNIYHYL